MHYDAFVAAFTVAFSSTLRANTWKLQVKNKKTKSIQPYCRNNHQIVMKKPGNVERITNQRNDSVLQ